LVYVDVDASGKLLFSKRSDPRLIDQLERVLEETEQSAAFAAAVTRQLANAKTAGKSSEFGGLGGWCF
jgi:hypothetical protein